MTCARLARVAIILALSCVIVQCKVFTRCQLTRELLKNNYPRTFLSNWVCLIEQQSERNTSAYVEKSPRKKYYGLFQIGSEWCKEGRKGGKCDISCEGRKSRPNGESGNDIGDAASNPSLLISTFNYLLTILLNVAFLGFIVLGSLFTVRDKDVIIPLLDDDIKDDSICALKVFELEGFKYWSKWQTRCKGQTLPDIEKCPDWQHPPANTRLSPPRDKRTLRGRRSISTSSQNLTWTELM